MHVQQPLDLAVVREHRRKFLIVLIDRLRLQYGVRHVLRAHKEARGEGPRWQSN